MIRAISGWATATMALLSAAALVNLGIAFLPLADLHAVHHPGSAATALATALRVGAWFVLGGLAGAAGVAWVGWSRRVRANLAGFGVRSRRLTDSVGRGPEVRRRMRVLTWSLWGSAAAGGGALLL